ncbi:MAG: arsenite methyltransferase [Spirochaetota bacterium]|nr:arsenite methyltransferase [Spirochaetota bacterium]
MSLHDSEIKDKVKEAYSKAIKRDASSCCGSPDLSYARFTNYNPDDVRDLPQDSVQNSFGCGDPLSLANVKPGEVVLDIGSGAGLDSFFASKLVGPSGKVYGLDMTQDMIDRATQNASQAGITNVSFILGEAESIPLPDSTVDLVISNCVINLSPDKPAVFSEIFRVLKPGGRIVVSDILSESLPQEVMEDEGFYVGCVAGAISEASYLSAITKAGFNQPELLSKTVYDESALLTFTKGCVTDGESLYHKHKDQLVGKIASAKIMAKKPAA